MDDLGFRYAYTPVKAPQYNGIEEVFGLAKGIIKKKRLEAMLLGEKADLRTIIS